MKHSILRLLHVEFVLFWNSASSDVQTNLDSWNQHVATDRRLLVSSMEILNYRKTIVSISQCPCCSHLIARFEKWLLLLESASAHNKYSPSL